MHELSICSALLVQVEAIARDHGATEVVAIEIRIGPLAGVEGALLRQAFTIARAGTLAATAELTITETSVRLHCQSCGQESLATINRLLCAHCGDWHTQVIGGDELLLARVELTVD